jgi:multiple sugar transport system substrate-binding protein
VQDGLFYPIADAGFLIPLDDVVAGASGLNATNADGVVNGETLGVAWQRAVYALIYNKALIEKSGASVPADVDGLIAQAKAVSGATGAIGFSTRHSMSEVTNWFKDFQNWVYGYGGSWVDANGKLVVNSPEAVAATDAFKKVYDAGIIPLGDPMTQQRTRFKQGQVAFSIDNSGGTLNITSGGALASSDMAAAPLPFPHPGAHQQILVGVSAHSKHPAEAKAFLAWMLTPEAQQALRDASGPDALATDVPVTAEFAAQNPWAQVFADLAARSRSTLIPGYEAETAAIMRTVMEAVERVLITGVSAQEALDAAQAEIARKY